MTKPLQGSEFRIGADRLMGRTKVWVCFVNMWRQGYVGRSRVFTSYELWIFPEIRQFVIDWWIEFFLNFHLTNWTILLIFPTICRRGTGATMLRWNAICLNVICYVSHLNVDYEGQIVILAHSFKIITIYTVIPLLDLKCWTLKLRLEIHRQSQRYVVYRSWLITKESIFIN